MKTLIYEIPMKNILQISQKLKSKNFKLYIVGGFCRDFFVQKTFEKVEDFYENYTSGDIDLVTDAKPESMQKLLKIVGEVGKKYGTCIVSEGGETFEITTFRKDIGSINNRKPAQVEFCENLEEDAKRRDFTCNAIYYDLEKKEFADPEGGIADIGSKKIAFVGNPNERIYEDALRILRCVRFKNKYNFEFSTKTFEKDKQTLDILQEKSFLLKNISVERIKQELDKILLLENNVSALEDLKQINFFKHILPELEILETIPGNKHHLEGNVWIHTKMCIQSLNEILNSLSTEGFSPLCSNLVLYYTLLFHDIGKAPTLSFDEKGEVHYYDHEKIGAEMFVSQIAKKLKFSASETKEIFWLIENHIKLFLVLEMRKLKARKFMLHPLFEKLLLVGEADNAGRIPIKIDKITQIKTFYTGFKKLYAQKIFLTGNDIIKKFPNLSGRQIGEKLQNLNDEILFKD